MYSHPAPTSDEKNSHSSTVLPLLLFYFFCARDVPSSPATAGSVCLADCIIICRKLRLALPDGHAPYDENAMLFMDYRTDYVDKAKLSPEEAKELDETPTFLYAMPLGKASNGQRKIFFEEVRAYHTHCRVFLLME